MEERCSHFSSQPEGDQISTWVLFFLIKKIQLTFCITLTLPLALSHGCVTPAGCCNVTRHPEFIFTSTHCAEENCLTIQRLQSIIELIDFPIKTPSFFPSFLLIYEINTGVILYFSKMYFLHSFLHFFLNFPPSCLKLLSFFLPSFLCS